MIKGRAIFLKIVECAEAGRGVDGGLSARTGVSDERPMSAKWWKGVGGAGKVNVGRGLVSASEADWARPEEGDSG